MENLETVMEKSRNGYGKIMENHGGGGIEFLWEPCVGP